jgi:competence protein ComEC
MKKGVVILLVMMALLLGLILYTKYFQFTGFRVVFFNVGQGDSALIQFDNGQKMLVDCGPDKKILSKLGEYLPFYDRRIDYLLVTHFDLDHYGGCVDVLKRYDVGVIVENGVKKEYDGYWKEWSYKVKSYKSLPAGRQVHKVEGHEIWNIASTTLEFFSPDNALGLSDKDKEGNNSSIVFKLTHGSDSYLFTGDAEVPLENALIKKYCPSSYPSLQEGAQGGVAEVVTVSQSTATPSDSLLVRGRCETIHAHYLKIGHHGSDSSSGDDFINAVAPQTAIISVGKNTFGHPSLRVMRHLERAAVEIWRTDEKNDIILP